MIHQVAIEKPVILDWKTQWFGGTCYDHVQWLIRLRWLAVLATILMIFISSSEGLFPIFTKENSRPFFYCVSFLFASNVIYYLLYSRKGWSSGSGNNTLMAVIQVEVDLLILTGLLHFSGGVMNPFVLFYAFHVIIATIILPLHYALVVGVSAVLLYSVLGWGEMQEWFWLRHYPMMSGLEGEAWRDPGFVLWALCAFVGMVGMAQYLTRTVITRMRTKELEAVRNHEVLMAVINSMSEGLVFLTSNGKLLLCNRAARRWSEDAESLAEPVRMEDFPAAVRGYFTELIGQVEESEEKSEIISYGSSESGEKYIEMKSCLVTGWDNSHLGYVVVGNDLTEHKKLERVLRARTAEVTKINEVMHQSQMDMAEREKMSAIGQMASGIAHEIGNPLNSLSSIAQSLGRKYKSESDQKQFQLINDQVRRISKILKHMLGMARPASSNFKWMDVNKVIDEALALIKYDKRAQEVKIRTISDETLPTIWFCQDNLEQVLLNILLNSLYAMDAREDEGERILEVIRKLQGETIVIEVSDNGIGMSESVHEHAFEPFFTTKEMNKGTGLGLYISRNVMEESGGSIRLEDNPGGGLRVLIEFPVGKLVVSS
ncbi:MAG: hypothetical protein GY869_04345 [Planctomycetes bacterium]|nr:hypothetical protein [Planctomycetota bacterium]